MESSSTPPLSARTTAASMIRSRVRGVLVVALVIWCWALFGFDGLTPYAYSVIEISPVCHEERSKCHSPKALARGSGRRPWRTVIIWVLALVAALALTSQLLGDALTSSITFTDEPESITASNLIEEVRGEPTDTEFVVVTSEGTDVSDPVYVAYVTEIESALLALGPDVVTSVGTYLSETGPVSESGLSALLPVVVAGDGVDETGVNAETVRDTLAEVPAPDGFQALMAGPATLNSDFNTIAEEDLRTGETIGIAVALVVLVLVFGSVVSGVIPIILGVVAIGIAMGLAALLGLFMDLSFFITNMITMIGLAVGIDYSLFIVSRYREERLHGFEKLDAISRAGATATRAVFFSGLTVVLALVGMLILPNTLFRALGLGAILVVIVAVLASMTLLPAVLSLLGDRIDSLRVRRRRTMDEQGRMWDRITKTVMGRPVLSIVFAGGILLLAATSLFSINKGLSGVSTLPDDMESKQAFEILATEFAGGFTSPIEVVVTGSDIPDTLANLESDLAADGGFGPAIIDPLSTDDVAILSVQTLGDVNSIESQEALRHLRADIVPGASLARRRCSSAVRPRSRWTSSIRSTITPRSCSQSCSGSASSCCCSPSARWSSRPRRSR